MCGTLTFLGFDLVYRNLRNVHQTDFQTRRCHPRAVHLLPTVRKLPSKRNGSPANGVWFREARGIIQELNSLVEHKFISKKSYPEIPPKVEYSLTELGLETLPIIETLATFGLKNLK
jgi:hypothetical protein